MTGPAWWYRTLNDMAPCQSQVIPEGAVSVRRNSWPVRRQVQSRNPGLWRTTMLSMIRGAHVVVHSSNAEADRAFFRDVLDYPFVDAGQGWLIFALPPAELAIHPSDTNGAQELFLMCDDIEAFRTQMAESGVACSVPQTERWGIVTHLTLPGGGALGVYEPTHPSPLDPGTNRNT
jgi:hypothetical protein